MTEHEVRIQDKPKYEKPVVIDLESPSMAEGNGMPCSSGASYNYN